MLKLRSEIVDALIATILAHHDLHGLDKSLSTAELRVLADSESVLPALRRLRDSLETTESPLAHVEIGQAQRIEEDAETLEPHDRCPHGTDLQVEPCETCWLENMQAAMRAEDAAYSKPHDGPLDLDDIPF